MLVPQATAYALLAGLPPAYAAMVPVVVYALTGTSRHLAVGPEAIASLLTATALAPLLEEGTAGCIGAAALLALMVGVLHLVLAAGRLGFLVNLLSHSVLVGFTAAAAILIGFSQLKHLLGVSIERTDHLNTTVIEVASSLGDTHRATALVGGGALVALLGLRRFARRLQDAASRLRRRVRHPRRLRGLGMAARRDTGRPAPPGEHRGPGDRGWQGGRMTTGPVRSGRPAPPTGPATAGDRFCCTDDGKRACPGSLACRYSHSTARVRCPCGPSSRASCGAASTPATSRAAPSPPITS
jgi:hypothetical protein